MLDSLSGSIAVLIIFECLHLSAGDLKCSLVWEPASSGSGIPSNAVMAHTGRTYIARVDLEYNLGYVSGCYDFETNTALFPISNDCSSASALTSYEILTNPYGCNISWPQGPKIPEFALLLSLNQPEYIARTKINDVWIAGEIDPEYGAMVTVSDGEAVDKDEYQILTSYSKGLHLEIINFEFDLSGFAITPNFLGIDTIVNNADVSVTQVMRHHRNLTETLSFPISNKEDVSKSTASSKQNVLFPAFLGKSKTVTVENTYKETVEETKTIITETEVNLVKEITVPPHSSVTICSRVSIMENVKAPYKAQGIYSAPSLSAEEVLNILKEEGVSKAYIKDGQVMIDVQGEFHGSMAMNTEFFAESSDNAPNCMGVAKLKENL